MTEYQWYIYPLVIFIGFVAGFVNTLAGGGSLLTLPLLMFLGLPANIANGTNRIAILLQNIVGVRSFQKQKVLEYKHGLKLSIPAIIGSIIGASFAVELDENIMRKTIAVLLIIMFFLILYKPDRWIKGQSGEVKAKQNILQIIIFFFIGIYGGFIQAGVGFFLLAGLVLGGGFDLVRANALKMLIVLLITIFAIIIFIYNEQVNYQIGFILAIGNMMGAYIATKFAVNLGAKYVRYFVLTVLALASIKFLGLWTLLKNMIFASL